MSPTSVRGLTSARARLAVSGAVVASALLVAAVASAEPGTIVLTTGEVLRGEVTEVVNGDHLLIRLPSGELRTVAWIGIGSMQIGGSGTIILGPPPATTPPPPPAAAPQPPPPPTVVYAPPPPPPAYAPPPARPLPPPRGRFQPRVSVGGRLGTLVPGGNLSGSERNVGGINISDSIPTSDYVHAGGAVQGDVGFHFSPSWTVYGFWELGGLSKGKMNSGAADGGFTSALGLGINANTNPDGPVGFYFDVGLGYRWLSFAYPTASARPVDSAWDRATYSGVEILRLGLGVAISLGDRARLDVMLQGNAGQFSRATFPGGVCGYDRNDCSNIPGDRRGVYSFGGLVAAMHFDL